MHPRVAYPHLNSLLQAQSAVGLKPIVVSSEMLVVELLNVLQRIISVSWLNAKEIKPLNKMYKNYEADTKLSTSEWVRSLEEASIFILVINGFDLVGVVTEKHLIQLFNTSQEYEQFTLFEVIQRTIAPFPDLQMSQLIKLFSLFQQYWTRCLPLVNSQGQVMGTINCETMRSMVKSYIQGEREISASNQESNASCERSKAMPTTTQEIINLHASAIYSSGVLFQDKQPQSQLDDLRSLEAKLAQKTAECQHINRQLQEQIDENTALKRQLDSYQEMGHKTAHLAHWPPFTSNLKSFFEQTVTHVQELLQCDRVCIYHYEPGWSGLVVAEAVKRDFSSILNFLIRHDLVSNKQWLDRYQQGEVCVVEDMHHHKPDASTNQLNEETITLMDFFQVEANLMVPIQANNTLWGLLVVHQCAQTRCWQPFEISLLQIVTSSLKAAIEQSRLSEKIQQLHTDLYLQEQMHIHRLQQALDFEAMLNRVTDRVRDSLDEQQILQTAIQELVTVLGVRCCQVVLCNLPGQTTCEQFHHYSTDLVVSAEEGKTITEYWELSQQAQQGQCCQFCLTEPLLNQGKNAILVCPVFDDQGYLGALRLYARRGYTFNDGEIGLVQQVASHCAIAIRQARLYQASQTQVHELEHLHQLKDDFLSTVSHELRTPLSSIKMVTNLLKMTLNQSYLLAEKTASEAQSAKISQYLKVLEEECEREIHLVDDLLATQNLNTGIHPLSLTTIHLQDWMQPIVESFQHRARFQQQRFEVVIADNLPTVVSDAFMLSRILVELLTNACKYTPPGDLISLELSWHHQSCQIKVKNSGVEIAPEALPRIFDPFYRIPKSDRWKNGGTGLGLSLIKRLVEYLGGKIWVESGANTVQFFVDLPLNSPA